MFLFCFFLAHETHDKYSDLLLPTPPTYTYSNMFARPVGDAVAHLPTGYRFLNKNLWQSSHFHTGVRFPELRWSKAHRDPKF